MSRENEVTCEAISSAIAVSFLAMQIIAVESDGEIAGALEQWREQSGIKTETAALIGLAASAEIFILLEKIVSEARARLIGAGAKLQ
jgi:hypothetical protein